MPNRIFAALASAALYASITACSTRGTDQLASDTAPSRANSSWCQGDKPISYAPAPEAGAADPANVFDTEETVAEIQAHNARYRAACTAEEQK